MTGIRIPKMIDIDIKNERILKEYIDGETIFELIKQDLMDEKYLFQVKEMARIVYSYNLNIDFFLLILLFKMI